MEKLATYRPWNIMSDDCKIGYNDMVYLVITGGFDIKLSLFLYPCDSWSICDEPAFLIIVSMRMFLDALRKAYMLSMLLGH